MAVRLSTRPPAEKLIAVCVVGTRPEVIKMAPVVRRLAESDMIKPVLVSTGQHSGLLDMALNDMGLTVDYFLNIDRIGSSLVELTAQVSSSLEKLINNISPAFVVAQGDTNSVLASSLTAFFCNVPFVHVEAGLRSNDIHSPFPEEFNRKVAAIGADIHCAPNDGAAQNLVREGVPHSKIIVTGNTGIDSLLNIAEQTPQDSLLASADEKLILVTAHRRENFGGKLEEAFAALRTFVDQTPDVKVLMSAHPNPLAVAASKGLANHDRITLCEPLPYSEMVKNLKASWIVMTDSGGLQEEAPALGKPVLVMRESTERPETVASGNARLVGTDTNKILEVLNSLHSSSDAYAKMAVPAFPFGDGKAAARIVNAMEDFASAKLQPILSKISV